MSLHKVNGKIREIKIIEERIEEINKLRSMKEIGRKIYLKCSETSSYIEIPNMFVDSFFNIVNTMENSYILNRSKEVEKLKEMIKELK